MPDNISDFQKLFLSLIFEMGFLQYKLLKNER